MYHEFEFKFLERCLVKDHEVALCAMEIVIINCNHVGA